MEDKIPRSIFVIHFSTETKIVKYLTTSSSKQNRTYQIIHKDTNYTLKDFRIQLNYIDSQNAESVAQFKDSMSQISEIFQEYHLTRTVCLFNPHVIQPLSLDYEIEVAKDTTSCSCMHVQIVSEYGGVSLNELKPTETKLVYALMHQSARALSLLHNLSIAHLDIRPSNMVYDSAKNMMKLANIGKGLDYTKQEVVPSEYKLPEELQTKRDLSGNPIKDLSLPAVDTYCWAKSFETLHMYEGSSPELESGNAKGESESDRDLFTIRMNMRKKLLEIKTPEEMAIESTIENLVFDALIYNPKEMPSMRKLVSEMKKFENEYKFAAECTKIKIKNQKSLMERPIFSDVQNYRMNKTLEDNKEMVRLECGHDVTKDYLINYALESFVQLKEYNHLCLCIICQEVQKIKSFPLDCDCVWANPENIRCAQCPKGKPLSMVDLSLISDYINFRFVFAMLYHLGDKASPALVDLLSEKVKDLRGRDIIWALKYSKFITKLKLRFSEMDGDCTKSFEEALRVNKALTELKLEYDHGEIPYSYSINSALEVNKTLLKLDLSSNQMYEEEAEYISKMLKANKTLVELNISQCDIGSKGVKLIGEGLKVNKTLTKLDVRSNKGKYTGIESIGKALESNETLKDLDIGYNLIGDKGAELFSEILKSKRTLTRLAIYGNEITHEGTKFIAEMLVHNKTLTHLYMGYNNIGDKGAILLSEALKANGTLVNLKMPKNEIKDEGVKALGEMLKINKSLNSLNLNSNSIENEGAVSVSEALKVNKTLAKLKLKQNGIGAEGADLILEALESNTIIVKIDLRWNRIPSEKGKTAGAKEKRAILRN
eukprot:TRINITY_DN2796_c0_g1_i16.p1 TRINITY_DN2796_c0_g1~~TRINITY_DN2796_c0_g1_i16.p1  ORF type:complete len:827 (-),score=170.35 TRINITY_DN2796_c0_g1_i16:64-2544(-)